MDPTTSTPKGLSRRDFVGASALAVGLGLSPALGAQAIRSRVRSRNGAPLNVILMISDGMSPGVLQLGDHFALQHRGVPSAWMELCQSSGARTSLLATASANGPVTDSAAAGTAFSVGGRTNNGRLNVMPGGAKPTPLAQRVKASGRSTGIVSTAQLAHATPAAFVVNHADRHDYAPIAVQMLAKRPDVMLGGGTKYFTEGRLRAHASDATVLRSRGEVLKGLPGEGAVMGFFSPGHMSYEIDREDNEPSLAEMTSAALQRLQTDDNGFFLMVEGARIDHAAHANDILTLLHDQLAFDDALSVARRFADERGDTLVVVTSDHGNANPAITMYAEEGAQGFAKLKGGRASFGKIRDEARVNGEATAESYARALKNLRGLELHDRELDAIGRTLARERVSVFKGLDNSEGVLGSILANHYATGFVSTNHTSDHVVLTTTGPMHDQAPVLGHITDLHAYMARALRLA